MEKKVIEVHQISKQYGLIQAVDGVDLAVEAGQVFGLIGHNGAGKSTLFKMMLGLIPASSGEIRIDGVPVRGEEFRRVRRHLGYLPENIVFYDNLSGLETLSFFARLKGVNQSECAPLLERVGLSAAATRRVKGYSKGMRQRLGFAQALLGMPKLLFLDEPTTGLDPEGIREFYSVLTEMKNEGTTIILTSHILSEIQERVDRLAIMKTGKIQAIGTVQSLREKMALPLRFELRLEEGSQDELRRVVAALEGAELSMEGERFTVYCQREAKMQVLKTLAALNGRVTDLNICEPSLEDVFLGY